MAKVKSDYESKAVTTSIRFTSRASICVDKNFFTVEACEERLIPEVDGIDIEQERKLLWDTVNEEVDNQIADIIKTYKK